MPPHPKGWGYIQIRASTLGAPVLLRRPFGLLGTSPPSLDPPDKLPHILNSVQTTSPLESLIDFFIPTLKLYHMCGPYRVYQRAWAPCCHNSRVELFRGQRLNLIYLVYPPVPSSGPGTGAGHALRE